VNGILGVIENVLLEFTETTRSTPRAENLTALPATITAGSTATATISDGIGVIAAPTSTAQIINTVTAFDGLIDYGGVSGNAGSGFSAPPQVASAIASVSIPMLDPAFPQYVGAGTVSLTVVRTGAGFPVTGPTISTRIDTEVSMVVLANYQYRAYEGYLCIGIPERFGAPAAATGPGVGGFKRHSNGAVIPMAAQADLGVWVGSSGEINGYGFITYWEPADVLFADPIRLFRSLEPILSEDDDAIRITL
jgi:hypothetical protein